MIDKLIFGRFVPGESWIHALDARTKLLGGFYFIAILFLANNPYAYALMIAFTFGVIFLTGIKVKVFIKGVRPLLWLILFTVIMQMLFTSGGVIYFEFGPFRISSFGIINGIYVFIRFTLIIILSTVITLTTTPMDLTDAIEYLLRPLKYLKVPVADIALMITVALRFIPTLMEETDKIMKAQRARGIEFGEGNLFEQMKVVVPIFIPLFVSSFNRAEDLADAMEVRGYDGGKGRTKFRLLHWHWIDLIALVIFVVLTAVLIFLRGY
ncbi:FAD export ECF transporter transmembrane subunit FmnA [Listeria kieliensis]|uniref:Energy-coupling factor transporter transmembrane protein EcfT n=1 Tax=Listeria kieliensis TaxID=1621700 RepID=A0A3D8TRS6_9LIST|nr:FAD export ECF transporter transmembrane subunit FmnA [Listeria kieliensis]RDX01432.1 cobalt ABC transporter ATP-binding protein [Listeria kieliensis]